MNWLRLHRRSAALLSVSLLLPVGLYLYLLATLLGLGIDYAGQRSRLEPRVARLQGMLDEQELVMARAQAATAALRERVYAPSQDGSALAAQLQARLRDLFADAGMRVSNSQVLPPRDRENFQQVSIKLTVEGSLSALDAALAALAAQRPRILIENFDSYPARQTRRPGNDDQLITAVIELFALREPA